jgi:hypothetical protein
MLATYLKAALAGVKGIQYVGGYVQGFEGTSSTISVSLGGTLSGGIASSPSVGDLVIVYFAVGANSDINIIIGESPAPYTEIVELYSNDSYDTNLAVAYRQLTGGLTGDLSTFAISGGTGGNTFAGAVAVQVWRNVDGFDVTQTTATGTNSVLCKPPAITPITTGAVVVSGGAGAHNQGIRTFSSSDLTAFLTAGGADGSAVTIGLGHKEWTSGAFDPAQFTFSGSDSTSYSWAAVTLALRPK